MNTHGTGPQFEATEALRIGYALRVEYLRMQAQACESADRRLPLPQSSPGMLRDFSAGGQGRGDFCLSACCSEGKELRGELEWPAWPEFTRPFQDRWGAAGTCRVPPENEWQFSILHFRKELKWDQAAAEHVVSQWYSELDL